MLKWIVLSLVASASADSCMDAVMQLVLDANLPALIGNPNQAYMKSFCSANSALFATNVTNIASLCISSSASNSLSSIIIPALKFTQSIVCTVDQNNQYCWPEISKFIDYATLTSVFTGSATSLSISSQFTQATLQDVCASKSCSQVVINDVILAINQIQSLFPNSTRALGIMRPLQNYAADLASACVQVGRSSEFCVLKWLRIASHGISANKSDVCSPDGSLDPCLQAVLIKQAGFLQYVDTKLNETLPALLDFCCPSGNCSTPQPKKSHITLHLMNLLHQVYLDAEDLIALAIRKDIAFNLNGVLDVNITITRVASGSVIVEADIPGDQSTVQLADMSFPQLSVYATNSSQVVTNDPTMSSVVVSNSNPNPTTSSATRAHAVAAFLAALVMAVVVVV